MANRSGMLQMGFLVFSIWLITADPVEYLLPVPMPELIAGPDTTRIDGVIIRDGVPDFASVIDARDRTRLTSPSNLFGPIAAAVGIARWSATEQSLAEPWLLGRKPLAPAPIFISDPKTTVAASEATDATVLAQTDTTTDATAWLKACDPALTALRSLPAGELAIPMALHQNHGLLTSLTASEFLVLGLINLGNAELATGLAAAHRGDRDALVATNTLVSHIAGWLVDSRHPFAFSEALQLQEKMRDTWLIAVTEHGNPALRVAIGEWNSSLPAYDPRPALGEWLRLSYVTVTAQRCAQFRRQAPTTDTAKLVRRNAPPDPNIALQEVQMACDAADGVLGECRDIAALAAVQETSLPQASDIIDESFDSRPLAERMLFRNPVGLRRAFFSRRFAAIAIVDMHQQQQRVLSRAKTLVRRWAAVNVALAIADHHHRTGTLPNTAKDLPATLQSSFTAGDTAIALTCTATTCTIVTTGDKPVTLWHYTISPPATTP